MIINTNQLKKLNDIFLRNGVQYDVYPYDSYTLNGLLVQFFRAINECIDSVNELTKIVVSFNEWIEGEGLQIAVNNKLEQMVDDGTLSDLINQELFGSLLEMIENNTQSIEVIKNKIKDLDLLQTNVDVNTTNLKRLSPVPNDDNVSGEKQDFYNSLHFKLNSVMTNSDDIIFYDDIMNEPLGYAGSELVEKIDISGEPPQFYTNEFGEVFRLETYTEGECIMKSPISQQISNTKATVKFISLNDKYASVRVGWCSDVNNWVVASIDRVHNKTEVVWKKGGVLSSVNGTPIPQKWLDRNDTEELKLHLINCNNVLVACCEFKNKFHLISECRNPFDFTEPQALKDFKFSHGVYIKKDQEGESTLTVTGLQCSYTGGISMGADFKPVTYEDSCPIKNDFSIYLTGTTHCTTDISGNGTNLFKMDLHSNTINLVSKIALIIGGKQISLGSPKIFFDRDTKEWVYIGTNFNESPVKSYIARTKRNLLSGIHVIVGEYLNIPQGDKGTWDLDVYKDNGKYNLYYTVNGDPRKIVKATSNDLINWSQENETFSSKFGEGSVITKIGGRYMFTHCYNKTGLQLRDANNLNPIDFVDVDIWSGNNEFTPDTPMPWGAIIPIQSQNFTNYILVVFSMRKILDREYGYGDMWLYNTEAYNNQQEYKSLDMKYFD